VKRSETRGNLSIIPGFRFAPSGLLTSSGWFAVRPFREGTPMEYSIMKKYAANERYQKTQKYHQ
jgi:hypothetical protein